MARGRPFRKPAQDTISAAGTAQATVVVPGGVWWKVTRTSVSTGQTDPTVPQPRVRVYFGPDVSEAFFIEQTPLGNGASSDTPHDLEPGDSITAYWEGGTAGKRATLTLAGLQYNSPPEG